MLKVKVHFMTILDEVTDPLNEIHVIKTNVILELTSAVIEAGPFRKFFMVGQYCFV